MKYIVDRFEGSVAVCNNRLTGEMMDIEKKALPDEIKEGDVVVRKKNGFAIDEQLTEERRKNIKTRMNKLFKD